MHTELQLILSTLPQCLVQFNLIALRTLQIHPHYRPFMSLLSKCLASILQTAPKLPFTSQVDQDGIGRQEDFHVDLI